MIDDDRVRFYLQNRDQLEEWFGLRDNAAAAVDQWLGTLREEVATLAGELGADVMPVPMVDQDQSWPGLYLKRSSWRQEPDGSQALIGLQWTRGKALLLPSNSPWVGVRVRKTVPTGMTLREDEQFQGVRKKRKDGSTLWWAANGLVPPNAPFPDQADDYRTRLIDAIRSAWSEYAPSVDRAFAVGP